MITRLYFENNGDSYYKYTDKYIFLFLDRVIKESIMV